jgi:hypothetical protein
MVSRKARHQRANTEPTTSQNNSNNPKTMPTQRLAIEAIGIESDSSILDPATIHKPLKGSILNHAAFGGLRHVGSASFAAVSWAKEKK